MDRRKSIRTLVIGGVSIGVLAEACKLHENSPVAPTEKDKEAIVSGLNRMKEEIAYEKKIEADLFFHTGRNDNHHHPGRYHYPAGRSKWQCFGCESSGFYRVSL